MKAATTATISDAKYRWRAVTLLNVSETTTAPTAIIQPNPKIAMVAIRSPADAGL
jgi:hypothetical protein